MTTDPKDAAGEKLRIAIAEKLGLKPIKSHPLTPVHPGVPNYPNDPAAALLLVEHMRKEGLYFECITHLPEGYRVKFWLNFRVHEATAPTLPLAVVRCFAAANNLLIS